MSNKALKICLILQINKYYLQHHLKMTLIHNLKYTYSYIIVIYGITNKTTSF